MMLLNWAPVYRRLPPSVRDYLTRRALRNLTTAIRRSGVSAKSATAALNNLIGH